MAPSTAPASLALQAAVARVCRVLTVVTRLADTRRSDGPPRTRGDLWLCGRPGEIEAFVADLYADRSSDRIDDAQAATALDAYAEALERDVRTLFGERRGRPRSGIEPRREARRPP